MVRLNGNLRRWGVFILWLFPVSAFPQAQSSSQTNSSDWARPRPFLVHVVVALCDNASQGIVPVPARIGNGEDPQNNLFWGAAFGVKTYFSKSKDWTLQRSWAPVSPEILERIVLKHKRQNAYIVADAFRGREIRRATATFFLSASGALDEKIAFQANGRDIEFNLDDANIVAYVGHDGLMEFSLARYPWPTDTKKRQRIVLACSSKTYFAEGVRASGAYPLLWTRGLMAPEAYSLAAAIEGALAGESGELIRRRAAREYNRYQRCGEKAAVQLFSSGW